MAKAPGSGAEGARLKSHYDLVKDHLLVKLACLTGANITFAIIMHRELCKQTPLTFNVVSQCLHFSEKMALWMTSQFIYCCDQTLLKYFLKTKSGLSIYRHLLLFFSHKHTRT